MWLWSALLCVHRIDCGVLAGLGQASKVTTCLGHHLERPILPCKAPALVLESIADIVLLSRHKIKALLLMPSGLAVALRYIETSAAAPPFWDLIVPARCSRVDM